MIDLIKKNKLKSSLVLVIIIINLTVAILALIPADKDVTAPGGLNEVKTVIKADTDTNIVGSFNTIYVYSIERVSILQAWIAGLANYNEVSNSSKVFHLTDEENLKAGQIQKNQSIEASLICAYHNANKKNPNINLEYNFVGFIVRNYQIKNEIFKIGDLIVSIYDNETNKTYGINNPNELKDILNKELTVNDKITFVRDNEEFEVTVDKEFDYYNNQNMFYCYSKYDIKEESANPSYKLFKSNTLGPSGGLMQTLSVYSEITGFDYTYGRKIAGTGTISVDGTVGKIGGVSQKIVTAIHNNADIFLCPAENYEEALATYLKTPNHEKMILIKVSTFEEAINSLGGLYE